MIDSDKSSRSNNNQRVESDDENSSSDDEMNHTSNDRRRVQNRYTMTKPILKKFGERTMDYFRLPPRPTFLLGSLDQELLITHKKARQRRAVADRTGNEVRTKIKELDADSNENESSSTVREIERIFKVLEKLHRKLNGNCNCNFFRCASKS